MEASESEESVLDFMSERSHASQDSEEEESTEASAEEYTIEKLYTQIQGGFQGCTLEEHQEKMHEHMEAVGNRHSGLSEIFHDTNFPSVLGLSGMITPERLARQQETTPEQWEATFCGTSRQSGSHYPANVCLHKEETQGVEPIVAFDIDSFLGFATSLALARRGLWYQPSPNMKQNIKNDIHLQTTIFQEGDDPEQASRPSLSTLRDVPHFLLGRVEGAHDVTIYVLFPHLPRTHDRFVSLSQEQLTRWTDQVLFPALHEYYPAHYTQHIPASYRHAGGNSKAHQVEGRKIKTASYQARLALGYHLQPQYLGRVWNKVLDTIESTPGLRDFREPQLFFNAKGTKLRFKTSSSQPTLLDAMEGFEAYFADLVDLDFI